MYIVAGLATSTVPSLHTHREHALSSTSTKRTHQEIYHMELDSQAARNILVPILNGILAVLRRPIVQQDVGRGGG